MLQNIFVLTGTIIGAGVFSLPILYEKTGIYFLFFLFLLGFVSAYLSIKYLKLISKLKKNDQMPKYIEQVLGKTWSRISLFLFISSLIGALIGYLLLIQEIFGSFLYLIVPAWIILLRNIKMIKKLDSALTAILILSFISLVINSPNFKPFPPIFFPEKLDLNTLIKSYGVILFSFTGFSVIPDLSKNKGTIFSIWLSYLLTFILYLYFATTVNLENKTIFLEATVYLAVITSYIPLSFVLEEVLNKDLKLTKKPAKLTALLVPVLIVLLGLKDFITALSITGGVFISLLQVLIILSCIKLFKEKGITLYLSLSLILFLVLGALSEIYFLF